MGNALGNLRNSYSDSRRHAVEYTQAAKPQALHSELTASLAETPTLRSDTVAPINGNAPVCQPPAPRPEIVPDDTALQQPERTSAFPSETPAVLSERTSALDDRSVPSGISSTENVQPLLPSESYPPLPASKGRVTQAQPGIELHWAFSENNLFSISIEQPLRAERFFIHYPFVSERCESLTLWTDASCHDPHPRYGYATGRAGLAAVYNIASADGSTGWVEHAWHAMTDQRRRRIYSNEGELMAISVALDVACRTARAWAPSATEADTALRRVTLLTDSQGALNCIRTEFDTARYKDPVLVSIKSHVHTLISYYGLDVHLRWIPRSAHAGILRADWISKRAAKCPQVKPCLVGEPIRFGEIEVMSVSNQWMKGQGQQPHVPRMPRSKARVETEQRRTELQPPPSLLAVGLGASDVIQSIDVPDFIEISKAAFLANLSRKRRQMLDSGIEMSGPRRSKRLAAMR